MEYKRSKALYLGIIAAMALIAGIAHNQPSTQTITVNIKAPTLSSQGMQVVEMNLPANDQNKTENEEATNTAAVLLDQF